MKKFDFAIGNPPYQEMYNGESSGANSIYDKFIDAAISISEKTELVHPARFLFNAGSTPKVWNRKMLEDPHLKILFFEPDSDKIFPNLTTPIKGGIAISYHDVKKNFGKIGIYTQYSELNSIIKKVHGFSGFKSLSEIITTSFAYHFTEKLHKDFPEVVQIMSEGHAYDLKSNVFEKLPHVFLNEKPSDGKQYAKILGREGNERAYKYIRREYINNVINFDFYKIYIAKANGSGIFGEVMAYPIIEGPSVGATETFLSIGCFSERKHAEFATKYIKTKFTRCMLYVLKVTQDVTPSKWAYVPLQDFTSSSDIDWSKSIPEIDRQLYKKYGLTPEEVDFIETHVKEME